MSVAELIARLHSVLFMLDQVRATMVTAGLSADEAAHAAGIAVGASADAEVARVPPQFASVGQQLAKAHRNLTEAESALRRYLVAVGATEHLVPAAGTNSQWEIYQLGGLHETPVPPHVEVPVETMFTALAEFLRTRTRPTSVDWQQAADIETMFADSD